MKNDLEQCVLFGSTALFLKVETDYSFINPSSYHKD
jgi:hypothetical protein